MKKIITCISAVLMIAGLFAACSKKDSSTSPSPIRPVAPTVVGKWQLVDVQSDRPVPIATGMVTDLWVTVSDCAKDDYYLFNADGTLENNQGAIKCNPNDPQSTAGTWKYSNNTLTLIQDSTYSVSIPKLTTDTMQWTGPATISYDTATINFTATLTLKRM
jgi:Lipocalin-like domain